MNMKNLFWILLLGMMAACSGKQKQDHAEERLISVTMEPLRFFVEQIAGDKYKVISMVPKGSSPETYDPTPGQLVDLGKSNLYFKIGYIGFEQMWMDKLAANAPEMKIIDTSAGIDLITDGHRHGHDHEHVTGVEPHIWNSPDNALIIARNIRNALCEADPANANYYQARFENLQKVILETDNQLREILKNADKAFLIYHPALSYFARDYGLRQISIEEGGKQPSPAHLKALIDECRKGNVSVIFVQQEFDTRNAELIAKETGTRIVPINPLSYDWQEEMIKVAKALSKEGGNQPD